MEVDKCSWFMQMHVVSASDACLACKWYLRLNVLQWQLSSQRQEIGAWRFCAVSKLFLGLRSSGQRSLMLFSVFYLSNKRNEYKNGKKHLLKSTSGLRFLRYWTAQFFLYLFSHSVTHYSCFFFTPYEWYSERTASETILWHCVAQFSTCGCDWHLFLS